MERNLEPNNRDGSYCAIGPVITLATGIPVPDRYYSAQTPEQHPNREPSYDLCDTYHQFAVLVGVLVSVGLANVFLVWTRTLLEGWQLVLMLGFFALVSIGVYAVDSMDIPNRCLKACHRRLSRLA